MLKHCLVYSKHLGIPVRCQGKMANVALYLAGVIFWLIYHKGCNYFLCYTSTIQIILEVLRAWKTADFALGWALLSTL